MIQDACSQHVLSHLYSPLRMTICLMVESCTHSQPCAHSLWKLFQKCAANLDSLFDTVDTATPCSWTISRMYNRQNLSKAKVIRTARKCADFVSRSTITHTTSCFYCVHGKWVTKSIVTCSHFHSATSNGCSSPACFWCSTLTC